MFYLRISHVVSGDRGTGVNVSGAIGPAEKGAVVPKAAGYTIFGRTDSSFDIAFERENVSRIVYGIL